MYTIFLNDVFLYSISPKQHVHSFITWLLQADMEGELKYVQHTEPKAYLSPRSKAERETTICVWGWVCICVLHTQSHRMKKCVCVHTFFACIECVCVYACVEYYTLIFSGSNQIEELHKNFRTAETNIHTCVVYLSLVLCVFFYSSFEFTFHFSCFPNPSIDWQSLCLHATSYYNMRMRNILAVLMFLATVMNGIFSTF